MSKIDSVEARLFHEFEKRELGPEATGVYPLKLPCPYTCGLRKHSKHATPKSAQNQPGLTHSWMKGRAQVGSYRWTLITTRQFCGCAATSRVRSERMRTFVSELLTITSHHVLFSFMPCIASAKGNFQAYRNREPREVCQARRTPCYAHPKPGLLCSVWVRHSFQATRFEARLASVDLDASFAL